VVDYIFPRGRLPDYFLIKAKLSEVLISITDGQVYLSPALFLKGDLPAVDVGKSVSRVGGKAQLPGYLDVSGQLRLAYSQFEELETFARFGTRLDDTTRHSIERGRRVREVLKQDESKPLSAFEQIIVLIAVNEGLFDDIPIAGIKKAGNQLSSALINQLESQQKKIYGGERLSAEDKLVLMDFVRAVLNPDSAIHHANA